MAVDPVVEGDSTIPASPQAVPTHAETLLYRSLVEACSAMRCPELLHPSRFRSPASVVPCWVQQRFGVSKNCGAIVQRSLWSWKVVVAFNEIVDTSRALDKIAANGVYTTNLPNEDGTTTQYHLLLTAAEQAFRPEVDPEVGSHLILSFEL